MKAEGFSKKDLPEIGVKRYRPSRHILKDKGKITLQAAIPSFLRQPLQAAEK